MAAQPAARQPSPIEWILGLLDVVGSQPIGARRRQCPNPGHGGDSDPSLSISERDGGVRLHCFAGCPEREILEALGLGLRQLYHAPSVSPRRFVAATRLKLTFPPMLARAGHPAARGFRLESVHQYSPAAGTGHRITRHHLQRWRLPSGAKELLWESTLASGITAPGLMGTPLQALPLYMEQDVRAATVLHHLPGHTHQTILVVESESSVDFLLRCNTKLWASGASDHLTAWTPTTWAGGAHAVNTARLATVLGTHPYTVLLPDRDPAGLKCLRRMLTAGLGAAVLLGAPGEKPRHLYTRLGPERFARALHHAMEAARTNREPTVTVAADRLVDLPVNELGHLLPNDQHTPAAARVPASVLPNLAVTPASGHPRQPAPPHAITGGADLATTPARPVMAAASRPRPQRPYGAEQLPGKPPLSPSEPLYPRSLR